MSEKRSAANAVFGFNDPPSGDQSPAESPKAYAPPPPTPAPAPPAAAFAPAPSRRMALVIVVTVLAVLTVINLYLILNLKKDFETASAKSADQLNVLTRRADASDERFAQLKGQFEVTSEKLGMTQQELGRARNLAANIQEQQKAAVQQLNQAIAQKASAEQVNQVQADANTKIGGLSNDLTNDVNGLNKKIGETNDALNGTKGELSGAIAKTHDELVALAHRTDRDYFEFNIRRNSQQKVGNVALKLEKTNTKKNVFTVDLLFDDKRTVRKDQALDSPVYFYMQGASSALELVANKLDKDTVAGYISTPKGFFPNAASVLQGRPGGS
ncbi:MAG TPA: hypothetical protein VI455_17115 [Terriglobia bacterium]